MKQYILKSIVVVLFFLVMSDLLAQNCSDFHLRTRSDCAEFSYGEWNIYGQSKSALVELNSKVSLQVIFYGGKDYAISFCSDRKLYPIHYRLIEAETKKVIFDNEEDNYVTGVKFGVSDTKAIIIEVTALGKSKKTLEPVVGCLGIRINWKKTAKIGF